MPPRRPPSLHTRLCLQAKPANLSMAASQTGLGQVAAGAGQGTTRTSHPGSVGPTRPGPNSLPSSPERAAPGVLGAMLLITARLGRLISAQQMESWEGPCSVQGWGAVVHAVLFHLNDGATGYGAVKSNPTRGI